ncbi:MAG: zinc-dependent alcohol dehydrogenase family protein [Paracoccaceae bacterium]
MPREWVINAYDGFEGLQLQDCTTQAPKASEVRLRIEAFALNWGDNDLMNDNYSFSFSALPARIGIEAAGIVEAVGVDVTGIAIGDRYCTLPYFYDRQGASADTLIIDQAYVTKAPMGLTATESASVWMQFMTAYFAIVELAKAAPGRNILVPAGTSTAGSAALQIGRMFGAALISTTRSEANRQILLDNGADNVFVDDGDDIEAFLRDVTGGVGVHASFDPVGGSFMERYANALAKGGHLYLYGGLAGTYSNPPFLAMIQNSLWFHAYSLFNYVEDPVACERGKAFVYKALSEGKLKPNVDRVFPMEGYVDAWRYLKGSRTSYGKVVVETGV